VHEAFARAHKLHLGDELNVILQGSSQIVRVVGISISPDTVYALNPSAPMPDNLHFGIFWVPEKQLESMAKMKGEVNSLSLQLDNSIEAGAVIKNVDEILKNYGNKGAFARKDQISNLFVEDEIRQQKIMGIFLPIIFISVAAFLVNIIFARLISLQRVQIATLKALGYTNREVSLHYLRIIFVMMSAGTLPGIFLGWFIGILLMSTYKNFFFFPCLTFSLSPISLILGFMAGIIPCIVGGFINLMTAYNLTPAEAMKAPLPRQFLPTLLERLGLEENFSLTSRMIYRNLLLRPLRLVALILGLSSSISVIIIATSWGDMLDFVISTEFNLRQRQDMSVSFLDPLPQQALRELQKIKGVLIVEGYRSVPVRVRYKQFKRELALLGRKNENILSTLIDKKLREKHVQERGILLTRYFQKKWRIKAGDTIRVEFLDGYSKEAHMQVTGFIDDFMGISAYMNYSALISLLGEGASYNLVNLKVDSTILSQIYTKLRSFPFITSVVIKKQLLKGFSETVAGMIRVFSGIMILFSLIISTGVIYNTFRVSFSERSWEMSSLMVMGFSRMTVFSLLARELIVQVILSFLPGCVLGWFLVYLSVNLIHPETLDLPVVIERSTFASSILFVILVLMASLVHILRMISGLKLADALKIRE
jgi:putative ABC transport system permease protein